MNLNKVFFLPGAACAAAGAVGGFACGRLGLGPASGGGAGGAAMGLLGAGFGLGFAALARPLARTPGAGLLWGLAAAFLLWLAGPVGLFAYFGANGPRAMPLAELARLRFPDLAGCLLLLGAPAGLLLGTLAARDNNDAAAAATHDTADATRNPAALPFSVGRALTAGGIGGIAGGWAFSVWMAKTGFYPLIAGLVGAASRPVGVTLHFVFAVIIGGTFGLLFQRDVRGLGSSLGWGLVYGIFWWFLGPLTILPIWQGRAVDWSAAHAGELFGSLIGHIVYGLLLGVVYAVLDKAWIAFFVDSDPIRRQPEGTGPRTLLALARGAAGGLAGGLVFWPLIAAVEGLPRIATLAGGTSPLLGLAVHLAIAVVIGMGYGLLFERESPDFTAGVAWGMVYGIVWWFAGTLTLFPIWLGGTFTWTNAAAATALPSLIGHTIYGAVLALVYLALERRRDRWMRVDPRHALREAQLRRPAHTPAAAVFLLTLGLGVILPIILA